MNVSGNVGVVYDTNLSHPKADGDKFLLYRLSGKIPARLVLYLLSWSGFLISFIMRNDINLTILAMVKDPKQPTLGNITENYCYDPANNSERIVDYGGTLEWSVDVQYYILICFYWTNIVSQMVGGIVTQRFGTKTIFGFAQLVTAFCSVSIPWASATHYGIVIALRFIQGFACGLTWPAMYAIIGHWIPKHERSRFISSFQGFNIGTGISFGLCGFLISALGWKSVFYTTGSMGIIWCIFWYFLAFDSPETHPRITLEERQYIRSNTMDTSLKMQKHVPWLSIFCSLPAWAIGISSFGRIWVHYTFAIYGPLYMKSMLGFTVEKNGIWSGAPFIGSYISSLIFCYIADKLITHHLLPLVTVRKMFTCIAQIIPGILCILLGYLGCNITLILIAWSTAIVVLAASFAGVMANIVDISPNFSGPVLAFIQTILLTSSIFSPLVVTNLTKNGHTLFAWRTIFNISGAIVIITYIVYHIWGTAEIQPWDYTTDTKYFNEGEEMLSKKENKTNRNC